MVDQPVLECWTLLDVVKAAKPTPTRGATTTGAAARPGGEFFDRPTGPNHRRYEALRGYLFEGLSYRAAAARSGYSIATLRSLVRDFRAGKTGFSLNPRPGPTRAPAKNAARDKIIELRRSGLSAAQISQALAGTATPLNRTGVAQVLTAAGLGRPPARPPGSTGPPFRDHPARAGLVDFDQPPARSSSKAAGLLLTLPDLVGPGPARPGHRRRIPRHQRHRRRQLRAEPVGAQTHRHPPGLPRRRPGRRSRRRTVRRSDRAAEDDRPDHLRRQTS